MKLSPLILWFAYVSHRVNAQCIFCPSGIAFGKGSTVVPFTDGGTCQTLAATVPSLIDTSLECAQIRTVAHPLCCPEDIGPGCNFCSTGVENQDLVVDPSDNSTCADYGYISQISFPAFCAIVELEDSNCCPKKTGTPCNDFCPGGVTNPDVQVDFGEGESVRQRRNVMLASPVPRCFGTYEVYCLSLVSSRKDLVAASRTTWRISTSSMT